MNGKAYRGHLTCFANVDDAAVVDAHLKPCGKVMLRMDTGEGVLCLTVTQDVSDAIVAALKDMDTIRGHAIVPEQGIWLDRARAHLAAEAADIGGHELHIDSLD